MVDAWRKAGKRHLEDLDKENTEDLDEEKITNNYLWSKCLKSLDVKESDSQLAAGATSRCFTNQFCSLSYD